MNESHHKKYPHSKIFAVGLVVLLKMMVSSSLICHIYVWFRQCVKIRFDLKFWGWQKYELRNGKTFVRFPFLFLSVKMEIIVQGCIDMRDFMFTGATQTMPRKPNHLALLHFFVLHDDHK